MGQHHPAISHDEAPETFPARRPYVRQAARDQRHQTGRRGSDYDVQFDALPDRLRSRLAIQDGHWIWTGQANNKGYGLLHARFAADPAKRPDKRAVHTLVWESLIGLVPAGFELDHLCEFKLCANPQCLEEVTRAENQRRASDRQTHCRRAGHPRTPENVYVDPDGRTRCRPCARASDTRRAPRKRSSR